MEVRELYKIIGHRASRREGIYENSCRAFEAAARYADGLETDAVLSADGEIFFIHDMTTSGGAAFSEAHVHMDVASRAFVAGRSMDQMKAEDIRRLRLVDGQKIPDFEDLFSATSARPDDFFFHIEIRAIGIAPPILARIEEKLKTGAVKKEQMSLLSFDHPELLSVRNLCPDLKICAHFDAGNFTRTPIYPGRGMDDRCFIPFSNKVLEDGLLRDLRPDYIGLNEYDFRPDAVERIAEKFPDTGLLVWWYYREPPPPENDQFFNTLRVIERNGHAARIRGIITDYPKAMSAFLRAQG